VTTQQAIFTGQSILHVPNSLK